MSRGGRVHMGPLGRDEVSKGQWRAGCERSVGLIPLRHHELKHLRSHHTTASLTWMPTRAVSQTKLDLFNLGDLRCASTTIVLRKTTEYTRRQPFSNDVRPKDQRQAGTAITCYMGPSAPSCLIRVYCASRQSDISGTSYTDRTDLRTSSSRQRLYIDPLATCKMSTISS